MRAGLAVTLNSDDPTMFGSPLAGEYELARRQFVVDDTTLAAIARCGVDVSFAPVQLKAEIRRQMDEWLNRVDTTTGAG